MNLRILAAGNRMPAWVDRGVDEYTVRLPRSCPLSLIDIPLSRRTKSRHPADAVSREGRRMLGRIPDNDGVIALDVGGQKLSTDALAARFSDWLHDGRDRTFLIGGPDGLAPDCLERADWRWSVSPLTLPHGLVRVVVAEALYRAFTVMNGHPYHRA